MATDPLRGCHESAALAHHGRDTPGPWEPRARRHELCRDGWRPDTPAGRMLPVSNPGAVESAVMAMVGVRRIPATCPALPALPTRDPEALDAQARRFAEWQTTQGRWLV